MDVEPCKYHDLPGYFASEIEYESRPVMLADVTEWVRERSLLFWGMWIMAVLFSTRYHIQQQPEWFLCDAQFLYAAGRGYAYQFEGNGYLYGEPFRWILVPITAVVPRTLFLWGVFALNIMSFIALVRSITERSPVYGWIVAFTVFQFTQTIIFSGNIAFVLAWLLTRPLGLCLAPMVKLYLAPVATLIAGYLSYHRRAVEDVATGHRSVRSPDHDLDISHH